MICSASLSFSCRLHSTGRAPVLPSCPTPPMHTDPRQEVLEARTTSKGLHIHRHVRAHVDKTTELILVGIPVLSLEREKLGNATL